MTNTNFASVCSIQTNLGRAVGVFVSPRRVLTCWHVVAGSTSVMVETDFGVTSMKRGKDGGQHRRDVDLDLAVIEVKDAIGHDFALPPKQSGLDLGDIFHQSATHVMKTRYHGQSAQHSVFVDFQSARRGMPGYENTASFSTPTAKVVPGYSGSPIFAKDGETLVSIVTAHVPEHQDAAERLGRDFARMFGGDLPNAKSLKASIPFVGVRPDLFARWYRSVAAELNF